MWKKGTLETSQKLQNLLFPEGIFWDKEIGGYRTEKENSVIAVMCRVTSLYKNNKEKKSRFAKKSRLRRKKSRIHQRGDEPRLPFFSKSRIYQIAVWGKPTIGDGVLWRTPCKRRQSLKRSLETAKVKALSLGGSVVTIHHRWGHATLDTYTRCAIFCVRRSLFSAKPTFFPRSGFFFGRRGM